MTASGRPAPGGIRGTTDASPTMPPGSSAGPANSTPHSSKVSRAAAHTSASARSVSMPNPLRPPRRRRPGPRDIRRCGRGRRRRRRKHHRPGGEFHCGVPSHQEDGKCRLGFLGRRAPASRSRPAAASTGQASRQSISASGGPRAGAVTPGEVRPSITSTAIDWPKAADRFSRSALASNPAATTLPLRQQHAVAEAGRKSLRHGG